MFWHLSANRTASLAVFAPPSISHLQPRQEPNPVEGKPRNTVNNVTPNSEAALDNEPEAVATAELENQLEAVVRQNSPDT